MEIDVVVGGFYSDEGKGKIVHYLVTERKYGKYNYVIRANASTNASHTVYKYSRTPYISRQLPSVFDSNTKLIIAPGALLNLEKLVEELEENNRGYNISGNLFIASNIGLIIEPYIDMTKNSEHKKNVGSTNQGTGVGTMSRVMRHGLKLFDIENAIKYGMDDELIEKIKITCEEIGYNLDDKELYDIFRKLVKSFNDVKRIVGDFCVDYTSFINNMYNEEKCKVLIEGCNGILIDNLHGIHPYTTSVSTNVNALLNGANLSPACLRNVFVASTAYVCCLNKRPFITEMNKDESEKVYKTISEIDPAEDIRRRVGWFDLPAFRKSLIGMKNCNIQIIMNKLDGLYDFDTVKVCTKYLIDDKEYEIMPDNTEMIKRAKPIYETFKGWNNSGSVGSNLPLTKFLKFIEDNVDGDIVYCGFNVTRLEKFK